jgi:hypothetical protein
LEMHEGEKIEVCLLPGFSHFECLSRISIEK